MKPSKPSVGVGVVVGLFLHASMLWAQDWPQWRGPQRDAHAAAFDAPATWPKELHQQWKVTVGGGDATPALVGDRLYVFTRQGGDEVIRCLDANTGKELWKDQYETAPATGPAGGPHAGPRCSPAVAEGKVVTLGVRGVLSCLDASTGKKLWRRDDFKGSWPRFFTASSPLIVNGLCIAQEGSPKNGGIVAYDLASGEPKWKWTGEGPSYASPVVMTIDGTQLMVALTESKIVALTAADGKLAWEAPFAARGMAYNASTPIVDGQTIIYGGGGRSEKAVKIEKQGDHFTAKELWSNSKDSVQFNTPVLADGLLVGVTQNGQFFALNEHDGQQVWNGPAATPSGGSGRRGGRGGRGSGGYGSIVEAGRVLLALTPSSQLVVFKPQGQKLEEVASYKVAETPTYAYPVVSGKRIYIKDQDSVTLWTVD